MISSWTTSTEILPPLQSVAILATAAFRSRKLPFQAACGDNAKSMNFALASRLKVTRVPFLSAYFSSSNCKLGSRSSRRLATQEARRSKG